MSKSSKNKTESKSTPIVPTQWQSTYDNIMGGLQGLTSRPSLNSNQTGAADYFRNATTRAPQSIAPAQTITPQTIAGPQTITPQQIMASLATGSQAEGMNPYSTTDAQWTDFSANKGSEFMGDYENKYLKDVVDTSLRDYDDGTEMAQA